MWQFNLVLKYLIRELQLNIWLQFHFRFTRQVDVDDVLPIVANVKLLVRPYKHLFSVDLSNNTCSITPHNTHDLYK